MNKEIFLLCLFGISSVKITNARLTGEGIQGGDDAEEGSYPYQVSVQNLGNSICGGSIIGERYVVTAAHCVINMNNEFYGYPINVVAGTIDLRSKDHEGISVDVVRAYVPKKYNATSDDEAPVADIAVLQLRHNLGIKSNKNIAKVDIPEPTETYAGVKAIISGFGLNKIDVIVDPTTNETYEANGFSTMKMRYAKAKVLSNSNCQNYYKTPIVPEQICAGLVQRSSKNPEGVCSGDSGGPLVYKNALIGVVSSSPLGCREDKTPAVYTRVSSYINFILDAVVDNVTDDMRSQVLPIFV